MINRNPPLIIRLLKDATCPVNTPLIYRINREGKRSLGAASGGPYFEECTWGHE